jgi:hypothetical protein
MSDPIANAEIEDVLSSIRRLVSAEERGERPGRPQPKNRENPNARLVLTPAHRVDDAQPEDVPEASSGADQDHVGEGEEGRVEIDLPEPDMPPSAEEFDTIEDAELVGEGGDSVEAAAVMADHAALYDPQAGEDDESSEDEEPAWFMRHAAPDGDASDDAAPKQADTSEPDTDDAARDADDAEAYLAGEVDEVADEITSDDTAEDAAATRADLGELGARIAEFESVVAEQPGDWEPDGTPDDGDNAADPVSPLPWDELEHDASTPDDNDDQARHAGDTDERAGAGGWYSEEPLIDEDALRDLVGEIVRQELQGALGERITRNVRKLVRREIHRALMSQGLDD